MAADPSHYLTFRAAGRLQRLLAGTVREVVKLPRTTRVPHAPPGVIGLANIRGSALPILSLGALQGKPGAADERVLVLDRAQPIGLLVEEVGGIVDAKGRARALDVDALIETVFRQAKARAAPVKTRATKSVVGDQGVERPTLDILSFIAGDQEFALPLDQVAEVLAMPATITRLPDADDAVLGTIAHRGALLPILALVRLLGLAQRDATTTRVVVATLDGHRIGLAVDAARSVLRVDEAAIDAVPSVIARRASEARIQAIARIDGGRRLVSILAADHLVDEASMKQLGQRREDGMESGGDMQDEATEPFLIFGLGEQSFGLPAGAVDEVVRLPEKLTRLPRSPAFIEGVVNLRGRAIPVIDQRRRFGGEASPDRGRLAIVVRLGTLQAAFVVDGAPRLHRIGSDSIALAPDISNETRVFDRTALMPDGSIVLLIEPGELLDGAERDVLTALRIDQAST